MAFYLKSTEDMEESAPVGADDNLQACIKSAAIVALIEDNFKFVKCNNPDINFESLLATAKEICDNALDSGDISSNDFDHVVRWLNENRYNYECEKSPMDKLICHIVSEEVTEICPDCAEEFKQLADTKASLESQCSALKSKYGEMIFAYVNEFVTRYGRLLDENFKVSLGFN